MDESGTGQVVVSWGRRTQGFPTEDDAMVFIRKEKKAGDRIVRVEKDGYRVKVRADRGRWRRRDRSV